MDQALGNRKQQLLTLLLNNKKGLSIDKLAKAMEISRNAAQQHMVTLEKDGYIEQESVQRTSGRPMRIYTLTGKGNNQFQKQYAWFAELMLRELKKELGSDGLVRYLQKIAGQLGSKLNEESSEDNVEARIDNTIILMQQLGYQADLMKGKKGSLPAISACNCVFHDVANQYHEVCEFDIKLLEVLTGEKIELKECMAKGGDMCRFKVGVETNTR